ncbi:MAG: TetR/AcrR family transcriptional regulator [Acidimicrobiales bacterium]
MAATTLSDGPRSAPVSPALEARVLDAAVACVQRWGVAKTTLDDVAREAGCSRASVYRAFPGGKELLLEAAGRKEVGALLDRLADALDTGRDLTDTVTRGLVAAVTEVRSHPVLQYLVEHEPGVVLPHVSFDGLDPLLALATDFLAPYLARFVPERDARELAEVLVRLVVSHAFEPSPYVDLTDPGDARRFVVTYVLAGVSAPEVIDLAGSAGPIKPQPTSPSTNR